jgi:hypothetical protein
MTDFQFFNPITGGLVPHRSQFLQVHPSHKATGPRGISVVQFFDVRRG